MPHRRVVRLREEEAEAELVDRALDPFRRQLELEAERLEHVCRPGLRRRRAVAVLRDRGSRGRGDERGSGRDVVRVRAVAAGAHDVDEIGAGGADTEDVLAHRLGAAGDLVRRLALRTQRDEEAGDLHLRRVAGHDHGHRLARLVAREVVAVEQPARATAGSQRSLEEVARERRPVRRQHRLGMELDADRGELAVPHGHHLAVVRERGRLEHVGQPRRGERVVAPGFERIRADR